MAASQTTIPTAPGGISNNPKAIKENCFLRLDRKFVSMAGAVPTASSTKETTNYARLCRLLVDVGTQALRDTFNAIHAPANLHIVLAGNKATLQPLRARKLINPTQWGKLFPVIPSSVSSASFDITLLMSPRVQCSSHFPRFDIRNTRNCFTHKTEGNTGG